MITDFRHGLRMLVRNFRLTLLAGTILGLAIGGSAAIFSLINAVFLRPLAGVSEPGQLVRFERVQPGNTATNFSYPDYLAYRDENRSFLGVAGHCTAPLSLNRGRSERIRGDLVTGNYFSTLGVKAALGRLLVADDDRASATPVAVLSYGLWRRTFGLDAGVLGQSITINGHPVVVVGVADSNFTGTQIGQPSDVWLPLATQPWGIPELSSGILLDRAAGWVDIFGRVKRGVRLVQAQADMTTIGERLAAQYAMTNAHRKVHLIAGVGIDPDDQQDVGRLLGLLFAAVGILLITAAANIATLLLARGIGRQHETAVRLAIGGTPAQVLRQVLVEALLLSSVAGMAGVMLTPWVSRLIAVFRTSSPLLRGIDPGFDWRVAGFVVVVVIVAGTLLGLAPALENRKIDLSTSLKQSSRTSSTRQPKKQQLRRRHLHETGGENTGQRLSTIRDCSVQLFHARVVIALRPQIN